MGKKFDMIGKRFGRLVVIEECEEWTIGGSVKYLCKCDCGNEKKITGAALRSGNTKSCGCLRDEYYKKINTNIKCVCNNCNKVIKKPPSLLNNLNFCCEKCRKEYCIGENSPNWKGGKTKRICETCGKEFEAPLHVIEKGGGRFCSKKCKGVYSSENYIGENSTNWKGGLTTIDKLYRGSLEYTDWRTSCMARDDFTCKICGKRGGMLNVHHIRTVKEIFEEYNIKTKEDLEKCEELFNLDNGVTLCEDCHKEIHFGKK